MYLKRIAIASLLALAIFGAVYGLAATISVTGVQNLGSGSSSVHSPSVDSVEWILSTTDPSTVTGVKISLNETLPYGGKIFVKVSNAAGTVTTGWTNGAFVDETGGDLLATESAIIDFTDRGASDISAANADIIQVVVQGP